MKKSRILNSYLNAAIADLGHGDLIVISDAGFPIGDNAKRVDLALEQDVPGIVDILDLIMSDFIYEACYVAEEQKTFNPQLFAKVSALSTRCPVTTVPHEKLIGEMRSKLKYVIRTGAFEPWGNVILQSGIDAPVWFEKPGAIAPSYYEDRVNYREEK
ncbi:D-ribose pyranase [Pleomorphomonas sp. T1.2MG-36]|uniref:D-ribose pyranase n=1 Tax=Pleomorphomonas sp. T1.2MG-36 TaxID=3041167 RepID=UPI0024773DBA|nr:D-ribose pyranase [Pleomorphomonas sp. T1.2MG-36]CAI9409308.1 D-ribose pyranase [Pleomorphomonas sp. T1.2MG-36]